VATTIDEVLPPPNPFAPVDVRLNVPKAILPVVKVKPVALESVVLLPSVIVEEALFIVILDSANGLAVPVKFPVIVPEPPIVKGLPPPVNVPLPNEIFPFRISPALNDTAPFDKLNVPVVVKAEFTVTVVEARFIVKLFSAKPPLVKGDAPDIAPLPLITKLEVEPPASLFALNVIAPPSVSVLAPIPNLPLLPNAPLAVTDDDKVTSAVGDALAVVLLIVKLFIVAGNKAPVVCTTEPLKVKLVLLLAPLVKLKVPVPGKVPLTPFA
jgi:hypothetical protein